MFYFSIQGLWNNPAVWVPHTTYNVSTATISPCCSSCEECLPVLWRRCFEQFPCKSEHLVGSSWCCSSLRPDVEDGQEEGVRAGRGARTACTMAGTLPGWPAPREGWRSQPKGNTPSLLQLPLSSTWPSECSWLALQQSQTDLNPPVLCTQHLRATNHMITAQLREAKARH